MSEKIILDTDIGSDIDDAVCLAYLLAQPRCQLLGITTVSGQVEERARLASALCRHAGQEIPIFPGAEAPLLGPQRQPKAPQAQALSRWPHQQQFPPGQAVEFLRQTIRANPGEVTLLAIGPLTNLALLFAADPEIPRLLKGLVLMCGVFALRRAPLVEWNAGCDPHAAAMVYRAPVALHRSIGLDVTMQVQLETTQVRQRFQIAPLQPVLDFAEVWFGHSSAITFHDPLAALTLFDEEVCGFAPGRVEVELGGERLAGLTHWTPGAQPPLHEVAPSVDAGRFFSQYFSVFG
ncbi:MAG: nucleoside hydrolase [Candidatus Latescibacteria bacterium]|nr:nucleoside hydrolase [Candidatus Latescibacterota bacterium]